MASAKVDSLAEHWANRIAAACSALVNALGKARSGPYEEAKAEMEEAVKQAMMIYVCNTM